MSTIRYRQLYTISYTQLGDLRFNFMDLSTSNVNFLIAFHLP